MSTFSDTTIIGVVTQTQPATDDAHLIRHGEAKRLLNALFTGDWNSGTAYTEGQSTTRNGTLYIANLDNTNKDPATNPTEWRLAAKGGDAAYGYVGYADDASGSGFSLSPAGKKYIAHKYSATPLTPVVGDFAGLWNKYVGDDGAAGATGATGAAGSNGSSAYLYMAWASASDGTGFTTTFNASLDFIAIKNTTSAIGSPAVGDFAGLWKRYGTPAIAVAGPITNASGTIGINAASANTASYVVQRDSNGDFAARKIVLGTGTATDHLTLGTSATMGYNGTAVAFNVALATPTIQLAASHELRTATSNVQLYSNAASANVFTTSGKKLIIGDLQLTGCTGVLKGDGSGNVAGAATSDDLTEGSTNLYYTAARVNTAADARITLQKGAASGLASLDGSGKLTSSQLPSSVVGATIYQGTWNANTNSPALASSTGTKGNYYVVTVAGATALDGVTDWAVGDWAIFDGSVWEKVDNTDAVVSVNGHIGTVVLTSSDLAEGSNLYHTDARVRACILSGFSGASGGSITAADTVLSALGKAENRLTAIEAFTTSNIAEGSNLYYTDARVKTIAGSGLNAVIIAPAARTSGSPSLLTITGPADTGLTATAEAIDVDLNLGRIVTFASGTLALQRALRVAAPKYAFSSASTLTECCTVGISGAPVSWTNATLGTASALRIFGGAVAAGNTNAYGLYVSAPSGASNNYAAVFDTGNVGIGTTAPTRLLDINSDALRLRTAKTPSSATDTGNAGDVCWDAGFVYVCVATNTWKRSAIATW